MSSCPTTDWIYKDKKYFLWLSHVDMDLKRCIGGHELRREKWHLNPFFLVFIPQ